MNNPNTEIHEALAVVASLEAEVESLAVQLREAKSRLEKARNRHGRKLCAGPILGLTPGTPRKIY